MCGGLVLRLLAFSPNFRPFKADPRIKILCPLKMDEHSVIKYLGQTSGLHLVGESSLRYYPLCIADCRFSRSSERDVGMATRVVRRANNHLWLLPSLAAQQRLLEIYFTNSHPYLQFLDQEMCVDISVYLSLPGTGSFGYIPASPHTSSRDRYRERATLILYTIFLLALSHLSEHVEGIRGTRDDYYNAVLDPLDQLDDHLTLETVQVLLMLRWREQGYDQSQRAWLHLGIS